MGGDSIAVWRARVAELLHATSVRGCNTFTPRDGHRGGRCDTQAHRKRAPREGRIVKRLAHPRWITWLACVVAAPLLTGCMVLAIADTVGTVAVKTVGLAADGAIGAVKITGKAVGAVADAVTPDATPAK
jgi:hypothetical protein